ncbi:hormogonium polysaccharide biosynthesis glycosyltransferase HpsE [Anabaena catenula]|uniref:Glycosyltransferase family 2 protein n=1 Tax=Anabaena catenula FACHB-362 TaxID=2692877 RepID=A0ABR8J497_9NOST|nr:hormogonium polysaccharide biosynthesis glycosyltransferase HpsE [Anabaena catenula]MBD2693186.1 glycosyltransferase family 2 protein [Anabaena catenula FACHB-362]
MSLDLTVAIPTYNGESRLPKVIEHLQSQQGVENLKWEILVIDNNSTDGTAQLVQNYQTNWNHPYLLKYLSEIQQGAAFARAKAIQEAQSEIICFLDDDNLPAPNWILEAYKFAVNNPQAGAIASRISGKFEVNPPENIKPIIFYLAITERGEKPHLFEPRKQGFPPTAGLVVRRQAWQDNVPKQPFLIGRVGSSMLGSEDAEALCYIQKAGWEIWYNPAMQVEHIIPASRLERNYLISLTQSVGLARHHLRMLILPIWQRPFAFVFYLLNDARKLILYYIRHRTIIANDVVASCELERLFATFISPFYLLQVKINRYQKKS